MPGDRRATVTRAGGRALSALWAVPGHGLLALDAINRDPVRPAPTDSDDAVTGVFVTIAHWRPNTEPLGHVDPTRLNSATARMQHVLDCLSSALELSADRVVIAISTNAPAAVAEDLALNAAHLPPGTEVDVLSEPRLLPRSRGADRRLLVVGWTPGLRRNPYYLTWAHKRLIRSAVADPGFSHFIYLEDDIRFTDASLDYWSRFRGPLAVHGLIPGFVRFEALDGLRFVVDQLERANAAELPAVSVPTLGDAGQTMRFVNLVNPYQGMYVLDHPLAAAHLRRSPARDPARSRAFSHWAIRERAAIGPIFDQVPPGFRARNVVPVLHEPSEGWRLDARCLVEHLTGNYTRAGGRYFGSIRLEELFLAEPQPTAAG